MQTVVLALTTRAHFGRDDEGQKLYETAICTEIALRFAGRNAQRLSDLRGEERDIVLQAVRLRTERLERARRVMPAGVVLTERLMRAAETLIWHQEWVECFFIRAIVDTDGGEAVGCQMAGRGKSVGTVRLGRSYGRQMGARDIAFEEVVLPRDVANRLEAVAVQQDEAEARRSVQRAQEAARREELAARDRKLMSGVFKRSAEVARNEGGQYRGAGGMA